MENQTPRFEAMDVGALLDRAFRLYGQNFSLMLGIVAITIVPVTVLQVILAYFESSLRTGEPVSLGEVFIVGFGNILVVLLLGLVAYPIAQGAATFAISERYLGQTITISEALKYATNRLGTLVNTAISVGVRVLIGMLLLLVPGLIWMCMYAIAVPIVVVEGMRTREGLRRSRELTQGLKGKIFRVLVVLGAINIVASIGAGFLIGFVFGFDTALGSILFQAVNGVVTIVVTPLGVIAATLLYYDSRIRKEGFDLEMLGQSFAAPTEPTN